MLSSSPGSLTLLPSQQREPKGPPSRRRFTVCMGTHRSAAGAGLLAQRAACTHAGPPAQPAEGGRNLCQRALGSGTLVLCLTFGWAPRATCCQHPCWPTGSTC
eukprot:scaffold108764_cov24-Tisochrysis_lutea.AAC.1